MAGSPSRIAENAACATTPAERIVQRYLRSCRAGVELTELADLVGIRPLAVLPGHFEHDRELLQLAMCEEGAEPIADQALPDVLVPVAVRSERRLGVVCVKRA